MTNESKYGYFTMSKDVLTVNSVTRLDLVIHIGQMGLPKGGLVLIEFPWGCWTPPIMAEIKGHAYLQNVNAQVVVKAKDTKVEIIPYVWYRGVLSPFVFLRVIGGSLAEGDRIVFQYGLENSQLPDARCQTYPVDLVDFKVKVNPQDDIRRDSGGEMWGEWLLLERKGKLRVVAGPPKRLELIAPTVVEQGKKFTIRTALTDMYRNKPTTSYKGRLEFEVIDGEATIQGNEKEVNSNITALTNIVGVFRLGAYDDNLAQVPCTIIPIIHDSTLDYLPLPRRKGKNTAAPCFNLPEIWIKKVKRFSSISNPVRVVEGKAKYQIYWGDIHVHSNISDGAWEIEEVYRYARDIVKLDIVAVSDHESAINFPMVSAKKYRTFSKWEKTQKTANRFYEPGRLVTFRGFEWTSNTYGHRNVYFPGAEIEDYLALLNREYDFYEMEPTHFYEIIGGREAIIIPHHTLVATNWDYHDPRELLVEIYSTWGRTEYSGNIGWDKPDNSKGGSVEGLKAGYRLGFIGGSDGHDSSPGRCYPGGPARNLNYRSGLMAVLAEELTRESIYNAMKARRTYATTGERIYLKFQVDGALMGSEIERTSGKVVKVIAEVAGTRPLRRVELVQNGELLKFIESKGDWAEPHWEIVVPPRGQTCFIYLRVEQVDGNMAWSSPVWITGI